jgi:hypothetical protein
MERAKLYILFTKSSEMFLMGSPTLRDAMFDLCGIQKVSRTPEMY